MPKTIYLALSSTDIGTPINHTALSTEQEPIAGDYLFDNTTDTTYEILHRVLYVNDGNDRIVFYARQITL